MHLKIAEEITSMFEANGKPMPLVEVMNTLNDKNQNILTSREEIRQTVIKLCEIFPNWIMLLPLPSGMFLK